MATLNADAIKSSGLLIEVFGLCKSAIIIAEYGVNNADVEKNALTTTIQSVIVGMHKCYPADK